MAPKKKKQEDPFILERMVGGGWTPVKKEKIIVRLGIANKGGVYKRSCPQGIIKEE